MSMKLKLVFKSAGSLNPYYTGSNSMSMFFFTD